MDFSWGSAPWKRLRTTAIDHSILLQRLSTWFGVSGTALLWFQFYLSTRSFSVQACSHSSQPLPLSCGSVLDPLLFILYITPLSHPIKSSSVGHHLYADYTQLFLSFSPASFSTSIAQLLSLVSQISQWMSSNLLRLNPSKTEFIIYLPTSRKFLTTLQYTSPITHLPLLSPLMPLSAFLVFLLIPTSLYPPQSL